MRLIGAGFQMFERISLSIGYRGPVVFERISSYAGQRDLLASSNVVPFSYIHMRQVGIKRKQLSTMELITI